MALILGLLFAGVLFIAAEIFMPSGVIATLGAIFLLGGVGVALNDYGPFGGLAAGIGALVVTVVVVVLELKFLPRTRLGRKMYNQSASAGKAVDTGAATAPGLIGKLGKAATAFAPTGLAEIDGEKFEASCLDGFLHPGDALVVAGRDNYKLLVKKAPGA